MAISIVSSNLAVACFFTRAIASSTPCSLLRSTAVSRAFCFFVSFAMSLALHNLKAHGLGGTFDDEGRRFDIVGVQILHLQLSDFGKLRTRDLTGGNLARFLGTRLQLGGLLDQEGCRRRLRREGKAAISINGDARGDRSEERRGGKEVGDTCK